MKFFFLTLTIITSNYCLDRTSTDESQRLLERDEAHTNFYKSMEELRHSLFMIYAVSEGKITEDAQVRCLEQVKAIPGFIDSLNPEDIHAKRCFAQAASIGSPELNQIFLERGFNPQLRVKRNAYSPIEIAGRYANIKVLKKFEEHGYLIDSIKGIKDLAWLVMINPTSKSNTEKMHTFLSTRALAWALNHEDFLNSYSNQYLDAHLECLQRADEDRHAIKTQPRTDRIRVGRYPEGTWQSILIPPSKKQYTSTGIQATEELREIEDVEPEWKKTHDICNECIYELVRKVLLAGYSKDHSHVEAAYEECYQKLHKVLIEENGPINAEDDTFHCMFIHACSYANRKIFELFEERGYILKEQEEAIVDFAFGRAMILGNRDVLTKMVELDIPMKEDVVINFENSTKFLRIAKLHLPFVRRCYGTLLNFVTWEEDGFSENDKYDFDMAKVFSLTARGFIKAHITGNPYEHYKECYEIVKNHIKRRKALLKAARRLHEALLANASEDAGD